MEAGQPSNRSAPPMCPKDSYFQPQVSWIQSTAIPMDRREEQLHREVLRLPVVQRQGEGLQLDLYVIAYWVLVMCPVLFLLHRLCMIPLPQTLREKKAVG